MPIVQLPTETYSAEAVAAELMAAVAALPSDILRGSALTRLRNAASNAAEWIRLEEVAIKLDRTDLQVAHTALAQLTAELRSRRGLH